MAKYKEIADLVEILETRKSEKADYLMRFINHKTLVDIHKKEFANKAVGVDNVTKYAYNERIDENVDNLLQRMKTFSYRPKPIRRVYIPKIGSDKKRPLGIPSYEDKLVQKAMNDVLVAIYENKFLDCSYGFRPKRSCHQAIHKVQNTIFTKRINYVVDCDIKGFFDNLSHEWLIKFLEHDIADKNFIRYIKSFLKADIMEQGKRIEVDKGSPQGASISTTLSNVYLHYVLDLWFEKTKHVYKGEAILTRYADDFIVCFQYKDDATMFVKYLVTRLAKFGLELQKEKTRIIAFGRFAKTKETFDFLGFTFINGRSWKNKNQYVVILRTSMKKLKVKRMNIKEWIRKNMHKPIKELIKGIRRRLVGHYNYYGVSGNQRSLENFRRYALEQLFKYLNRRSQKKSFTREKFYKLLTIEGFEIPDPKVTYKLY